MEKIICSIDELKKYIDTLLKKGHKKFLINGELGAGKTEFTRQFANLIGIKNISSPTYTYINIYEDLLLHGDFYRINNEQEFLGLGILEQIENFDYICIEWPFFKDLYKDKSFVELKITKINPTKRKIITIE